jgi:hypothetical protein
MKAFIDETTSTVYFFHAGKLAAIDLSTEDIIYVEDYLDSSLSNEELTVIINNLK